MGELPSGVASEVLRDRERQYLGIVAAPLPDGEAEVEGVRRRAEDRDLDPEPEADGRADVLEERAAVIELELPSELLLAPAAGEEPLTEPVELAAVETVTARRGVAHEARVEEDHAAEDVLVEREPVLSVGNE